MPIGHRSFRIEVAFAVLSIASLVVYTTGGPLGRGLTLTLVSVGVAVSVLVHLTRRRSLAGPTWWFVFIAFCFLSGASASWLISVDIGGATAPPQPVTQVAVALGYLCLLGAALWAVSPIARWDTGGVLDAATAGVGVAVVLWLTLLDPGLHMSGATSATHAFDLVVLVVLSALAGALVRAATASHAARTSLIFFLIGVTLTLAGNVLGITTIDPHTGAAPSWAGAVWPMACVAAWAAATHPASAAIGRTPGRHFESKLSTRRIVLLGIALGLGPLAAAARLVLNLHVDWMTLIVAQLCLITMVLTRVGQLASAHRNFAKKLEYLADHDSLTGLANRRSVDRHLHALTIRVGAGRAPGVAVLFVDLNRFKETNDDYGHHVGDQLLKAVADRLALLVRQHGGDLVGRLGGDEFVLILECDPEETAESARARVTEAFATPFPLRSGAMPMSASIGLASAPRGARVSVDDLLTQADHAMYTHKRDGSHA